MLLVLNSVDARAKKSSNRQGGQSHSNQMPSKCPNGAKDWKVECTSSKPIMLEIFYK
jgi:hypothetical protein